MNMKQKVILASLLGASLAFVQGNPVGMLNSLSLLVSDSITPDAQKSGESAIQQMGLSNKRLDDDFKRSSGSFSNELPCNSSQNYSLVPCIGTAS